jgi:hypothetical protein
MDLNETALIRDMRRHFGKRLRSLISDTVDTCEDGDMEARAAAAVILAGLLQEATCGSIALGMSEKKFMEMCKISYQLIREDTRDLRSRN